MMRSLFVITALLSSSLTFAAVPPEVPAFRTIQIFSPVWSSIGDNGETAVYSLYTSLKYGITDIENDILVEQDSPSLDVPAKGNLVNFLSMLGRSAGVSLIASHGWDSYLLVEGYEKTDQGLWKAIEMRQYYADSLNSQYGLTLSTSTDIWVVNLNDTWGVAVTPTFLKKVYMKGLVAQHPFIYSASCNSMGFWQSVKNIGAVNLLHPLETSLKT